MNIDSNLFILYVVSVVTMIIIPGPVAILVTGAGLSGGPIKALNTIFGTNLASLVLIVLSSLIIKGLFSINEMYFDIIKVCGALYIGYIGWKVLEESAGGMKEETINLNVGGFHRGFVVAISNPKDIIFFASFFPQFINITNNPDVSLILLTIMWVILDFSTLMLFYLCVRKITKPTTHKFLLKISGVLLIVISVCGILMSIRSICFLSGS